MKTIDSFLAHRDNVYDHTGWFWNNTVLYCEKADFRCVHAGFEVEELAKNTVQDPTWLTGDEKTMEVLPEKEWQTLPGTGLIGLDTGCVYGNRLTGMVIEGDKFWLDSVGRYKEE